MKKGTVIILKEGDGEYESYTETIMATYFTDKHIQNINMAYHRFLYKKYTEAGFKYKLHENGDGFIQPVDENDVLRKQSKRELQIIRGIVLTYTITYFIEKVIKAKRINFTENLY